MANISSSGLLSLSGVSTNKKFQHSQGRRFWTGYKPSKALNFYKINETAAGVALVLAAAVGFAMCVGHQLLGEEVLELHQHLVAPVAR